MKIDAMSLALDSRHQLQQTQSETQKLQIWRQPAPAANPVAAPDDSVSISAAGKTASQDDSSLQDGLSPVMAMVRSLLEKTFGIRIRLQDVQAHPANSSDSNVAANVAAPDSNTTSPPPTPSWGMRLQREFHYQEQESLQFSASGNITTSDGRQLSFQLDIQLQRSLELHSNETLNFGAAAKDPLMLTLGSDAGVLSGASVAFDLEGNGTMDALPMVANGGWLVLDRNGDGKVNDRSELFGPQSGNGFAELAQLDADGNGAIDEGDPLFARLQLWQGRHDGQDQLVSLLDQGIGALLLPNVAADYRYSDAQGNTQAQMRKAGVYLNEDGSAGLVSQLDLTA
ncbi:hypothetical protein [Vogesella oryzae]|uniref:hypothetical protein n=1 Tax=Vogesella oryzae TaxID=1735285 RepID=UPI0015835656|nr:hypothetical protein [Vogesella oryzae]